MSRSSNSFPVATVLLVFFAQTRFALGQAESGAGGVPSASNGETLSLLYPRLIALPAVQAELDLTESQLVTLREASDNLKAASDKLTPLLAQSLVRPDGQQQIEKSVTAMNTLAREMKQTLEETLRPEQFKRLKGIAIQAAGTTALSDTEIHRDLAMTEAQVAQLNKLSADWKAMIRRQSTSPIGQASQMRELFASHEKQTMDVLTDDQKALLTELRGAPLVLQNKGKTPRKDLGK